MADYYKFYEEKTVCYEVLEYLPFEDFSRTLCEIYRASGKYAVLFLLDSTKDYQLELQIPKLGGFIF